MQGTRDYIKYVKRGYGRAAQIAAFKARKGEISAEDAIRLSELHDGKRPASLDLFLEYVGLTEDEFREIASGLSVHPYSHDFSDEQESADLWDKDLWYREPLK
jgi:predicted nucleotidyltransferase